jgi:DNA-binding MurR/RpiR family transcriptional regulator
MMEPPTNVDALMRRVAAEFEALPRQLRNVATYLEQHRTNVMMDRISEIARACGVHPSAVVRFAQRFGFSGFSDMQALFREAFTLQESPARSYQQRIRKLINDRSGDLTSWVMAQEFIAASRVGLDELISGLEEKQFDAAVDLLLAADNIYVVGVRRSYPLAAYIVYALQHTNKRVHLISGLGGMYREQIRSVRKGDVLIAISFMPYGRETQYCARVAHHRKARVLLITDSKMAPLARHASALLIAREGSAFAFRSLTSTICLCQALFVALAYKLELNVEESKDYGGYDD